MTERIGIETYLGTDQFQKGMDIYLKSIEQANVNTQRVAHNMTLVWDQASNRWRNSINGQYATMQQLQQVTQRVGGPTMQQFAVGAQTGGSALNTFASVVTAAGTSVMAFINVAKMAYEFIMKWQEATLGAASRVQELSYVAQIMAHNTGISSAAIDEQVQKIKDLGIRTDEAYNSVIQFMQSELDMSKAAELARAAQDGAVIAATDSSQAYSRLIYAVSRLDTQILRTMGISLEADQVYKEYAETIGKTGNELTITEKKQAMLNAVLEESKKIAGAYEAAMESPGKQLRSFGRDMYELGRVIGEPFLIAFNDVVKGLRDFAKGARLIIDEGGPLRDFMINLGAIVSLVTENWKNLAAAFLDAVEAWAEGKGPIVDLIDWIVTNFSGMVTKAAEWGAGLIGAFADGIIQGVAAVMNALAWVGDQIAGMLETHSPPAFLPELDQWGADAMTVYMEGWKNGDFSALKDIGGTIRGMLESMATSKEGKLDVVSALIGSKNDIANAIESAKELGYVTKESVDAIVASSTISAPAFRNYVQSLLESEVAGRKLLDVQKEMEGIATKYDKQLKSLNAELRKLTDTQESNTRLKEIDEAIATGLLTKEEKDRLEKERKILLLKEEIAETEKARQAELEALEPKLEEAQKEYQLKVEALNLQKELIAAQTEQNNLMKEYQQTVESLMSGKGSGGGGGGGGAGEGIAEGITDKLKTAIENAKETLRKKLEELWQVFIDSASQKLKPITDAWENVKKAFEPVMKALDEWFKTKFPEAMKAVSDFWTTTLEPALLGLWNFIVIDLMPTLNLFKDAFIAIVEYGWKVLVAYWDEHVKKAFDDMYKMITTNEPLMKTLKDIWEAIVQAFRDIPLVLAIARGELEKFIAWMATQKVPGWASGEFGGIPGYNPAGTGGGSGGVGAQGNAGNNKYIATGGYAEYGTYVMGEEGTEYVLDAKTTKLAEAITGNKLTQERIVNGLIRGLQSQGPSSIRSGNVSNYSSTIIRNTTINMSPSYSQYSSPATVYYDTSAALRAAGV